MKNIYAALLFLIIHTIFEARANNLNHISSVLKNSETLIENCINESQKKIEDNKKFDSALQCNQGHKYIEYVRILKNRVLEFQYKNYTTFDIPINRRTEKFALSNVIIWMVPLLNHNCKLEGWYCATDYDSKYNNFVGELGTVIGETSNISQYHPYFSNCQYCSVEEIKNLKYKKCKIKKNRHNTKNYKKNKKL